MLKALEDRVCLQSLDKYVARGNIGAVKFHLKCGVNPSVPTLVSVVKNKDLEMLKLLLEHGGLVYRDRVLITDYACRTGDIVILDFLLKKGFKLSDYSIYLTAREEQVAMLKHLFSLGIKVTERDIGWAKGSMRKVLREQFNKQRENRWKA